MKLYNKVLFGLGICSLGMMVSCEDEPHVASSITNVADFTVEELESSYTTEEQDLVLEIPFKLSEGQTVDTRIIVSVNAASTATEGADFEVDHSVDVPAYVRTGVINVTIKADALAEGTETIVLDLLSGENPFGISEGKSTTISINNFVADYLDLNFDWDGEFEFDGTMYPICGNVDLDFLIVDATGAFVAPFDAASGACPEHLVIPGDFADGEYTIVCNNWENGLDGLMLNVPYPVTVSYTKPGAFIGNLQMPNFFTSEDPDVVNNEVEEYRAVMIFEKAGSIFTVKDADGTVIISGLQYPHDKVNK